MLWVECSVFQMHPNAICLHEICMCFAIRLACLLNYILMKPLIGRIMLKARKEALFFLLHWTYDEILKYTCSLCLWHLWKLSYVFFFAMKGFYQKGNSNYWASSFLVFVILRVKHVVHPKSGHEMSEKYLYKFLYSTLSLNASKYCLSQTRSNWNDNLPKAPLGQHFDMLPSVKGYLEVQNGRIWKMGS